MSTFNVIQLKDGEVIGFGKWEDTPENRRYLDEGYGYEETEDEYVVGCDGKFYIKGTEPTPPPPTHEEVELKRRSLYKQYTDDLVAERNRKQLLGTWTEEDEAAMLKTVQELSDKIVEENPYYD